MDPAVSSSLYAMLFAIPVAGMAFAALRVLGRLPWWVDLLAALALGSGAFFGARQFCRSIANEAAAATAAPRRYQATHDAGHWRFLHPGEGHAIEDAVWAEVGVAIELTLATRGTAPVRFAIRELGVLAQVVPGREQTVRLTPRAAGDHEVADPDATGTVPAVLHVVDAATFAAKSWRR